MSDNPFEDENPTSKGEKKSTVTESVESIKNMSIKRALSQIRWINFFLGLGLFIYQAFVCISNILHFKLQTAIVSFFATIFSGILALYELQFKKLGKKLRNSYGFLYTYVGRSLYILFLASLVFIKYEAGEFISIIIGVIVLLAGLYNAMIVCVHPAFKKSGLKLSDDPTVGYSAGESEISDVLKKNPALATKVISGAAKLTA